MAKKQEGSQFQCSQKCPKKLCLKTKQFKYENADLENKKTPILKMKISVTFLFYAVFRFYLVVSFSSMLSRAYSIH